jgi:hypothetical protein
MCDATAWSPAASTAAKTRCHEDGYAACRRTLLVTWTSTPWATSPPPLAADAESVELADGEEAERLRGPFGDGPVEVTGHAAARE